MLDDFDRQHIRAQTFRRNNTFISKVNDPFFCWQCVSLVTSSRTIDFVIENEDNLMIFISAIQLLILKHSDNKDFVDTYNPMIPIHVLIIMKGKMKIAY